VIKLKYEQLASQKVEHLGEIEIEQTAGSEFSIAEDRLMALGMHRYGYGFWELIRNDIRNDPSLCFNWLARSRTAAEI
jgi:SLIDE